MQLQRFKVTVHQTQYRTKPSRPEVAAHIRKLKENKIQYVNIYELASIFGKGQSVVLGVHDLEHPEKDSTSKETFQYQEVFSVDIDHGNFTLDELKVRLSELSFPYALIYKTFSYEEKHNKRWRVVFLSAKRYADPKDVRYINRYLVYMMAKDFDKYGTDWLEDIDRQSTDISRINFGGTIAQIEPNKLANFDTIFTPECMAEVDEFEERLQKALKDHSDALKEQGGIHSTQLYEKPSETAENDEKKQIIIRHANDVVKMSEQIKANLEILAYALPDKPELLNFYDRYEFINQLPLSMLLDVGIGQSFNCILPDHIDNNPSANLMKDQETGQERYHCFGCMKEGKFHTPFNVISILFEAAYGLTSYQTLQMIYEILNIELGSKYQKHIIKQLEHDVAFLDELPEEDMFFKKLSSKNAMGFYKVFLMLARNNVPYEPMVKDQECSDMVFFASNSYIRYYADKRWNLSGVAHESSVNRKINYLVSLGLIEKVPYQDLKPMMREKSKAYVEKVKYREERELKKRLYRYPDYYRLKFLTHSMIEKACDVIEFNKIHAGRTRGQSAKQAKGLYGEDRAKEIHLQSSFEHTKAEERFLNDARIQISDFLNDCGYFTEKELLRKLDPKNRYSTKKSRESMSFRLLPELLIEFKLVKVPINKKNREYYDIPDKIGKGQHIIFHEAVYEMLKNN